MSFEAGNLELTLRDEFSDLRLETTTILDPPSSGVPSPVEWSIDIGPTYGLQVDMNDLPEGEQAIVAMLVETDPSGASWAWSTRELSREHRGQRWLRYKKVKYEPDPGRKAALRLWALGTFFGGEIPVLATVGLHEHLKVELRAMAGGFRGSVTDTDGYPVRAHVIVLGGRPQGPGFDGVASGANIEWLYLPTDKEGRFEGPAVAAGTYQVVVCSSRHPFERSEVTIVTGAVTERSFVVGSQVNEVDTQVEVTDAATGYPVEGAEALLNYGSLWGDEVRNTQVVNWLFQDATDLDSEVIIGAPGYVPQRVRPWDCVQVGHTREYRVRLRRGHGAALVVVDADGQDFAEGDGEFVGLIKTGGVPGARVFLDNLETSPDAQGLALIESPAPIETITCEAPGWVMRGLRGFEPNGPSLGFVLMVRE